MPWRRAAGVGAPAEEEGTIDPGGGGRVRDHGGIIGLAIGVLLIIFLVILILKYV